MGTAVLQPSRPNINFRSLSSHYRGIPDLEILLAAKASFINFRRLSQLNNNNEKKGHYETLKSISSTILICSIAFDTIY